MDIIIFGTVYNYKFTTFFLLRLIIDNLFQLVSRSNYNHMFTLSSDKGPPLKCWLTIKKVYLSKTKFRQENTNNHITANKTVVDFKERDKYNETAKTEVAT